MDAGGSGEAGGVAVDRAFMLLVDGANVHYSGVDTGLGLAAKFSDKKSAIIPSAAFGRKNVWHSLPDVGNRFSRRLRGGPIEGTISPQTFGEIRIGEEQGDTAHDTLGGPLVQLRRSSPFDTYLGIKTFTSP